MKRDAYSSAVDYAKLLASSGYSGPARRIRLLVARCRKLERVCANYEELLTRERKAGAKIMDFAAERIAEVEAMRALDGSNAPAPAAGGATGEE